MRTVETTTESQAAQGLRVFEVGDELARCVVTLRWEGMGRDGGWEPMTEGRGNRVALETLLPVLAALQMDRFGSRIR